MYGGWSVPQYYFHTGLVHYATYVKRYSRKLSCTWLSRASYTGSTVAITAHTLLLRDVVWLDLIYLATDAVVTPWRKAASCEPRIAILGIWGDTWLTRGKYGIYVAVRGTYGAFTGLRLTLLPHKISPFYCRVSYVAVTRIPSLVLCNTWHYVILRYSYGGTCIMPWSHLCVKPPRMSHV